MEVNSEWLESGLRLKKVRKHFKLTQRKLADITGLSISNIWGVESGRMKMTKRTIMTLVSVFDVNEDWLETGKGNMLSKREEYEEILKVYNQMNDTMQKFFIDYGRFMLRNADSFKEIKKD